MMPLEDRRPRLLLVDDEPTNLQVLRHVLQEDYRLLFATDGAKALDIARRQQPDLVLLDVMMPGMDGLTTFARIHENPETANIPVILLTAKARPGSRQDWEGLPVSGVISKPFDPMNLPGQIQQLLGWE